LSSGCLAGDTYVEDSGDDCDEDVSVDTEGDEPIDTEGDETDGPLSGFSEQEFTDKIIITVVSNKVNL